MQPDGLCSVHLESSPRQRFSSMNIANVWLILVGSTKRACMSKKRRHDDELTPMNSELWQRN